MSPVIPRAIRLLPVLLLCACSHPHYRISLRSGGDIMTRNRPEYIQKTGYYRYRTLGGKDALVRGDEVLHIEEQ